MTIDEMKERKRELGLTNAMIASQASLPLSTVSKIFSGATSAPRKETIDKLSAVLKKTERTVQAEQAENGIYIYQSGRNAHLVCEPEPAFGYKHQGEYTLDDYFALPDEQRVELIDGVFYDMASPTRIHQQLVMRIAMQLYAYIEQNHGTGEVNISPLDVQLDNDNKTMVQPDIVVLCRDENGEDKRLTRERVQGAPDLVIEILSPSTRKKDMTLKHYKYANAGVREYWLVDPDKRQILVYDLQENSLPALYDFKGKVPVGIWNREFAVDFSGINDYIDRM